MARSPRISVYAEMLVDDKSTTLIVTEHEGGMLKQIRTGHAPHDAVAKLTGVDASQAQTKEDKIYSALSGGVLPGLRL